MIEIDQYYGLSSPIHRWDPRLKIVSIFVLIFSIMLLYNLILVVITMCFAIMLVFLSKIPISFILTRLKWVFIFVLPFLIILPFTFLGDGIEIAHFLGITLYYRGVEYVIYALMIMIKALTAVMLIFPMIGTSRIDITIKALEGLHIPNKLIQMFAFTYRYIFVLSDEFTSMERSLKSRGYKNRASLFSITSISKAIAMLLVKSYERADRVFYAMRSKGYTGTVTTLHEFTLRPQDWLNTIIVIGFAILVHIAAISSTMEVL
ncbi:MAG: cobalt ECF transporter T component CbiQ [Methanosarcinales archaeon]